MEFFFISYRRADTEGEAGRLFEHLEARFGLGSVFKDVDSILGGKDFREVIIEKLGAVSGLVALIGPDWLETRTADGTRCIDHPDDFVKLELEIALERGIPIIPIRVNGASMPDRRSLPKLLKKICSLNALPLRPDPDFRIDAKRICEHLEALVEVSDIAEGIDSTITIDTGEKSSGRIGLFGIISINVLTFVVAISAFHWIQNNNLIAPLDAPTKKPPARAAPWVNESVDAVPGEVTYTPQELCTNEKDLPVKACFEVTAHETQDYLEFYVVEVGINPSDALSFPYRILGKPHDGEDFKTLASGITAIAGDIIIIRGESAGRPVVDFEYIIVELESRYNSDSESYKFAGPMNGERLMWGILDYPEFYR